MYAFNCLFAFPCKFLYFQRYAYRSVNIFNLLQVISRLEDSSQSQQVMSIILAQIYDHLIRYFLFQKTKVINMLCAVMKKISLAKQKGNWLNKYTFK